MQVLIALAKAQGSIVTRDELIQSCWDGRIVGEDAVNRVMSRLRKAAGSIGAGSFGIETVTKIGYRLAHDATSGESGIALTSPMPGVRQQSDGSRPSRRAVLSGAVAAGVVGVGGALLYRQIKSPGVPAEVQTLMTQAEITREQIGLDAANETIAIYQRVLQLTPDYADAWGMMGFNYAIYSHYRERQIGEAMRVRAEAAGRRALELDPGNAFGELALSVALPFIGHWSAKERGLRRALARQPDNDHVLFAFGYLMMLVGRPREAARYYERIKRRPLTPVTYADYITALWSADRLEDTDRAMADAASLYPTHPMVWSNRFDVLLFSGRATAALAMTRDRLGRPQGLSEPEIERMSSVAQAMDSRRPAEVDAVMDVLMRAAREDAGSAEGAILVASGLGRVDEAFAVAKAYYFSRGFTVPDGRPGGMYQSPPNQRSTIILFKPVTRPLRDDPRFKRLVQDIGLEQYWRESGKEPDYRLADSEKISA